MIIHRSPFVEDKFASYPIHVKEKLEYLRNLIHDVAKGINSITELEETLKWGEPSFLVKKGSTLRVDWKEKSPQEYAMYLAVQQNLFQRLKNFSEVHSAMKKIEQFYLT